VAHKGFQWISLETRGRAAHGSRPLDGRDAILRMGRVLARLEALDRRLQQGPGHSLLGTASLHASLIEGGHELSSYPARAVLQYERRTLPGEASDVARSETEAILAELRREDPEFEAEARLVFARWRDAAAAAVAARAQAKDANARVEQAQATAQQTQAAQQALAAKLAGARDALADRRDDASAHGHRMASLSSQLEAAEQRLADLDRQRERLEADRGDADRLTKDAAQALGIPARRLKVIAVTASAALTSMCGTLWAQYVGFVDPFYVFSVDLSVRFALNAIIGGMGTAVGPFLGSILITSLETYLRATLSGVKSGFTGIYLIVYGVVLILVVRFIPEGLAGLASRLRARWTRAQA
jgi:hypothetical protein